MTTSGEAFHLTFELDAPMSPEAFRAAFPERGASSFVLDGGGAPSTNPQLDHASFMGAEPLATFRARRTAARDDLGRTLADVVVERTGSKRDAWSAVDPFTALRDFVSANTLPRDVFDGRHPFPFRGGLVGYIGYECGQMLERLPRIARPSVGMPDMAFALHRWVIATSRATGKSWLSVIGLGPDRVTARQDAEHTRDHVLRTLAERGSVVPC